MESAEVIAKCGTLTCIKWSANNSPIQTAVEIRIVFLPNANAMNSALRIQRICLNILREIIWWKNRCRNCTIIIISQ